MGGHLRQLKFVHFEFKLEEFYYIYIYYLNQSLQLYLISRIIKANQVYLIEGVMMPEQIGPNFEQDSERARAMAEAEKLKRDEIVEDLKTAKELRGFAEGATKHKADAIDDAEFIEGYSVMGKIDEAEEAARKAGEAYDAQKAEK
jgi:hypothetical protein